VEKAQMGRRSQACNGSSACRSRRRCSLMDPLTSR
jgi:hypothetical protein